MSKFLYQGHGSLRFTTNDGVVFYVDPYVGEGYNLPADLILVTHEHSDHNQIQLVTQKPGCTLITEKEALSGGKYQEFQIKGITVNAVPAYNKNHRKDQCVGYLLTFDGLKIYAAGDTSKTDYMETLSKANITYALFPIDGIYNMNAVEAAECATLVKAKHNIPVHMKPGKLFDRETALSFNAPNRLIVEAGKEIEL